MAHPVQLHVLIFLIIKIFGLLKGSKTLSKKMWEYNAANLFD